MRSIKTRSVKFSFGLVKDAVLEIPAEAYSINDAACLIRKSYLAWRFRPGCGLMSDEVVVSSLGQAHFFAGALGGYALRIAPETFPALKSSAESPVALACDVVRLRAEKQGRTVTQAQVYAEASKNEALSDDERKMLSELSKMQAVA
jgi:hypothetical protein